MVIFSNLALEELANLGKAMCQENLAVASSRGSVLEVLKVLKNTKNKNHPKRHVQKSESLQWNTHSPQCSWID